MSNRNGALTLTEDSHDKIGSEQALIQTSTGPVRRGRSLVVGSRGENMGVIGKAALY